MTSLNPLYTVGRQISEAIALHQGLSRRDAMDRAVEMLRRVQMPEAERRAHAYPHQLSGGMRQRVMIAMALSCNPKVLIADEPTTALDVTIQAQILDLMRELQETFGTAIILITHDMGVVAENADRVVVMYAGRKVEEAAAAELFDNPGHPYTQGLAGLDPASRHRRAQRRAAHAAQRDQGHGAVAVQPAGGLQLRAALQLRHRSLPCRRAGAAGAAPRPLDRLLARRPAAGRRGMTPTAPRSAPARGQGPQEALPDPQGRLLARLRPGLCGRRRVVRDRPRRDPGAGGRKRLRQVDGGPHAAQAAGADRRHDPGRRRRHHPSRRRGHAALPAAHADDLPGSLRLAEPAHDGGRDRGRAADHPRCRRAAGASRAGRRPVRAGGPAARGDADTIRTNSPAASASASASPARWRSAPT